MKITVHQIEELKNDFAPKALKGTSLPNPKSVSDGQTFYLKESDGVYIEYIMFEGKWNKKIVDSNSQVTLEQI